MISIENTPVRIHFWYLQLYKHMKESFKPISTKHWGKETTKTNKQLPLTISLLIAEFT